MLLAKERSSSGQTRDGSLHETLNPAGNRRFWALVCNAWPIFLSAMS
jgi:hypothetical protein